jgi:hypothetical protein
MPAEICGPGGGEMLALGNPSAYTGSTLTYQWYRNDTLLIGKRDSTLSVTGKDGAGTYWLYVSDGNCGERSDDFVVSYNENGKIAAPVVLVSNNGNICGPGSEVGLYLQNYDEYSNAATFQWYLDGVEIPGATKVSYETDVPGRYRIDIKDGACDAQSEEDTLRNISSQPVQTLNLEGASGTTICGEYGSVTLRLADNIDLTGATFMWSRNDSLLSHTQPTLNTNVPGTYKVIVTLNGCSIRSDEEEIKKDESKKIEKPILSAGNNSKICEYGGEVALWITNTFVYSGKETYQWYKDGDILTGETGANLRITAVAPFGGGSYKVEVIDLGCAAVPSSEEEVKVQPGSTATTPVLAKIAGDKICGADGSVTLGFTNSEFNETTAYVWFKDRIVIPGATLPTLTVSEAGDYNAYVTHNGCAAYSLAIHVDKDPAATPVTKPEIMAGNNGVICETNGNVALWITNVDATVSYQWFRNGALIPGATAGYYEAAATGTYNVVATDANDDCSATSDGEDVTLQPGATAIEPQLIATGKNGAVICGDVGLVTLKLSNSADYDGTETYTWFFNGNIILDADGSELVLRNRDSAGVYKVYVAFDNCGAFSKDVVVDAIKDVTPPTITCIGNGVPLVRETDLDVCTYQVKLVNGKDEFYPKDTLDNCTIVSVLHNYNGSGTNLTDTLFPLGQHIVTWTITDGSGLTATCKDTIRIIDKQKPYAVCYADTVYLDAGDRNTNPITSGKGTITAAQVGRYSYDNADACVQSNLSFNFGTAPGGGTEMSFDCSHIGTPQPVVITVKDAAGNYSTCRTELTVLDTVPPDLTISCPGDILLYVDPARYTCDMPVLTGLNLANSPFDNCGDGNIEDVIWTMTGATTRTSAISGRNEAIGASTFNVGTTTVTYFATDIYQNTGSCSFSVTVLDTIKPTVTAKTGAYLLGTDPGVCYSSDGYAETVANGVVIVEELEIKDNCQAGLQVRWRSEHSAATATGNDLASLKAHRYPRGSSTLWVVAEDFSGNRDSTSVTIEVKDVEPPKLAIPPDLKTITVACNDDPKVITPDKSKFTVTDNCTGPAELDIQYLSDEVADSTDRYHYTIRRKWRAYDAKGDDDVNLGNGKYSEEVIQYIIIKDTIAPEFTDNPARLQPLISCTNYEADIAAMELLTPVFIDNCDTSEMKPVIIRRDTIPDNGKITIKRTWEAKDASGNAGTWTQVIELPSNDLAVTVTASATEGYYGDQVDYVVTVINNGFCEVHATAESRVPAGLTCLSHALTAGTYYEEGGSWTIGSLAPGATATLTVRAVIADTLESRIRISAHAAIDKLSDAVIIPETDYDNNYASTDINAKGYAVKISKWMASGSAAAIDDIITFIVRVDSRINTTNADLWIRDSLPMGLRLEPLDAPNAIYGPDWAWVKVPVPPLSAGQHWEITIKARLTTEAGNTVINYAEIFRNSAPTIILDTATAAIYSTRPDLMITASVIDAKEKTGNKSYVADREYTFQVEYQNIGALPVRQATLTATFDPLRQRVLYTNNNGVTLNNEGKVTWQLTDILNSDPARSVEMRVEPLLPGASTTTFYIDTRETEWPKVNNADSIVVDQHIWIIPNVLTAHGQNQIWHIPQLEDPKYHVARARLTVTNVWGNMVYRNGNYKGIADDEKFSGSNLARGTYYYELIIEFEDGTTTLLRDWLMILK